MRTHFYLQQGFVSCGFVLVRVRVGAIACAWGCGTVLMMMVIYVQYDLRPSHGFPHSHKASTENTASQEKSPCQGCSDPSESSQTQFPLCIIFWGCLLNPATPPSILPSTSPPSLFFKRQHPLVVEGRGYWPTTGTVGAALFPPTTIEDP